SRERSPLPGTRRGSVAEAWRHATPVRHDRRMRPRFVILHGWENRRPADHWEHWLHDELVARGFEVDYPQLPDPDTPDLETWLGILDELVTRGEDPVTLVAHSLATNLWITRLG